MAGHYTTTHPVHSSNLRAVGWGHHTVNGKMYEFMEVEFRNGRMYLYEDVPYSVFIGLMKASSKGRFFARNIRSRRTLQRVHGRHSTLGYRSRYVTVVPYAYHRLR